MSIKELKDDGSLVKAMPRFAPGWVELDAFGEHGICVTTYTPDDNPDAIIRNDQGALGTLSSIDYGDIPGIVVWLMDWYRARVQDGNPECGDIAEAHVDGLDVVFTIDGHTMRLSVARAKAFAGGLAGAAALLYAAAGRADDELTRNLVEVLAALRGGGWSRER